MDKPTTQTVISRMIVTGRVRPGLLHGCHHAVLSIFLSTMRGRLDVITHLSCEDSEQLKDQSLMPSIRKIPVAASSARGTAPAENLRPPRPYPRAPAHGYGRRSVGFASVATGRRPDCSCSAGRSAALNERFANWFQDRCGDGPVRPVGSSGRAGCSTLLG